MTSTLTMRYTDSQRNDLLAHVKLAGDLVPPLWPLRTAVAINPLVGLEPFDFHEAVSRAEHLWGARGYFPRTQYRALYDRGRIGDDELMEAVHQIATEASVPFGSGPVSHAEVLRAHLFQGIRAPSGDVLDHLIRRSPDKQVLEALSERVAQGRPRTPLATMIDRAVQADRDALGRRLTLARWCDRILGTALWDRINQEVIQWAAGFVDEGHATWGMPGREHGLYGAWKHLLPSDRTGALRSRSAWQDPAALRDRPEDALLDSLAALQLPEAGWPEYLAQHLLALPGWAGHIKWRAEQPDPVSAGWARRYPADLMQYLAIRLFYEVQLVRAACDAALGGEGTYQAIAAWMGQEPEAHFFLRERAAGTLPGALAREVDRLHHRRPQAGRQAWAAFSARHAEGYAQRHDRLASRADAWCLVTLARAVQRAPAALLGTEPAALQTVLRWLDECPEDTHGRIWLEGLEATYRRRLIAQVAGATAAAARPGSDIRPQAQAVFCIDVRSEVFRRHLEALGEYETLGFAGFFICFIRFRGFNRHHDVNHFPVIMKARNVVREIPRSAHGQAATKYRARMRVLETGHALLHDLKEHVIAPFVMVESLGWFFSAPFIGKTLAPTAYHRGLAWLRRLVTASIGTTLTVDKLSREEVEEMLAVEQRAMIRRALREHLARQDTHMGSDVIETIRLAALDDSGAATTARVPGLSPVETEAFIDVLRREYGMDHRAADARKERLTQTGFTLDEQVFTVETALRMMGLTRNFGRLVAFIGHGSTVDNNPYEAALECGACGGNNGQANARLLAAMANKRLVRDRLEKRGLSIPDDTYFIGGQVDTCTDEVCLFDVDDVPATHRKDLMRVLGDLKEAGLHTGRERLAQLPNAPTTRRDEDVMTEVHRRSTHWGETRPEWGLAGNAAVVVGRRQLTRGLNLDGRVFLHSYDWAQDSTFKSLEIILTAPGQVMEWINMAYYFATVDNERFGAGNKIYHNIVGRIGVMSGMQSDLRIGLPWQSVMDGATARHEPMRLLVLVEAPRHALETLIQRHAILQRFYDHRWVHVVALEPEEQVFYRYRPKGGWSRIETGEGHPLHAGQHVARQTA